MVRREERNSILSLRSFDELTSRSFILSDGRKKVRAGGDINKRKKKKRLRVRRHHITRE